MRTHRDTLAQLLVWEIGKPWKLACDDVDRALAGVDWYLGEIERQLQGRSPLPGPVSNIASWNYPMSVQVHAELVQCLAGNGVVAKTPSQGGFHTLTLAHAFMKRAGPARDAAVRRRRGARRRPHQQPRDRRARVRRRPGQRPQGRHHAGRHRQAPPARAGGPERLGRLGLLRLGRARGPPEEGLRLRQAALHRLPAVRRAARAVPAVPRDVPAGRPEPDLRPPAGRREPGRRLPVAELRPGHLRVQGGRADRALRRRRRRRGHPALPRGAVAGPVPRRPGHRARTSPRPASSSRRSPGRCATPSRSGRSTRSCWSTPRPSCSPP